jgi:hypothetical protein
MLRDAPVPGVPQHEAFVFTTFSWALVSEEPPKGELEAAPL